MTAKKLVSLLLTLTIGITGVAAVAATPKVPFAEVDFSSLTTGFEYDKEYTSEEMMNIYCKNISSYGSGGVHKLVKEEIYGTSLQIYPQAASKGGSVVMQLPEVVTSGRIEVDISFKILGTSSLERHLLIPQNSSGNSKYTLSYKTSFGRNGSNNDTDSSKKIFQPSPDGNGFYNLVCVITSPDSSSNWTYEVYDKTNIQAGPFYTQEFVRASDGTKRQVLTNISGMYLVGHWATSTTYGDGTNGIEINKAVAYKSDIPKIVSVGEYDEITKSLTVTFDKAVSIDDANVQVSPIASGTLSRGLTNKEVVIGFEDGLGQDGTYSVNLSGVGYEESDFGLSYDFEFLGYATGSGLLKSIDYNTYNAKTYTSAELEALDSSSTHASNGTYEICDMGNGKNGLKISANSTNKGGGLTVAFGEQITSGRIQIDADVKMLNGVGSTGLTRNLFRPKGSGSPHTLYYNTNFRETGKHGNTSGEFASKPAHSDGLYRLSCVITADDETSDWHYELYDRDESLTTPFYTMTIPRAVNDTVTSSNGVLSYIDSINITDIWFGSGNKTDDYIQISGVKIYKTVPGELLSVSEFDNTKNSLELTYNTPVQVSENTKFVVTDENENKIFSKVTQKGSRKIILSFPWGIPCDGKLSITSNNVNYYGSDLGISSSFDVEDVAKDNKALYNVSFTDKDGNEVSNLDKLSELNLSFDSLGVTNDNLYMAVYKEGRLQDVKSKKIIESGNAQNITLNGADEAKVFVWDENFKPVFKALDITCTKDGESALLPLSVQGDFYTGNSNTAVCIKGNDTIYAKARLVAGKVYENLTANVNLLHGGNKQLLESRNITFENSVSNVSIPLDVKDLREGDVLEFVIKDNNKEYFAKKLYYSDPKYTIDILMVAGQSNAEGQYADKTLSVKPELGTVYYNTMGTTTLSTDGDIGWSGALGKTWHDRTGHTVLIVKAAWGGTGFEAKPSCYGLWSPDATEEELALCRNKHCYKLAKDQYNNAVASLDSYLDSGYEIGNCVYFWFQGENENDSYTPEQYKNAFMKMHNGFTTEFGTENTRLTLGGILPVRGNSSDSTISTSLQITGPRAAHSYLSNAREDLVMVSTATENWYSDASIKAWFEAKYPDGSYPDSDMPDSRTDVWRSDNVHYNQKIHNEFGEEAANSMLDYIEGSKECEGISLIGQTGIKHYKDGDEIILPETSVSPIINPKSSAKTATYTLTGKAAEISEYNVITPKPALENDYSVLTVTLDNGKTMTFKLYSPIADDSIVIAPVKDNKAAIYTLTTDDNYKYTNEYLDGKFEELGLVGTMGLIVNSLGTEGKLSVSDAQTLVNTGRWGVASHTMNHKQGKFQADTLTDEELEEEINGARDALLGYFPSEKIVGMYTPGGAWSERIVNKVKENHIVLRRAGGGSNSLPITTDKMLNLNVRAVFDDTTLASMNSWIDTAITNGQWVCEMWHGIGNDASDWGGNTTAEITDAHLEYIKQKMDEGKLWVTTLDEAGIYSYQRAKTKINKISENDSEIKISITDELDDKIFDSELTINVKLPEGWTSATVTGGGKVLNTTLLNGVLSFNAVHDIGDVIISKLN